SIRAQVSCTLMVIMQVTGCTLVWLLSLQKWKIFKSKWCLHLMTLHPHRLKKKKNAVVLQENSLFLKWLAPLRTEGITWRVLPESHGGRMKTHAPWVVDERRVHCHKQGSQVLKLVKMKWK